jgi:hypothetical protein
VEELAIHWNIEEHTTVGSHMFFAVAIASFVTNAIVTATSDSGTINFNSVIIYDASNAEYFSDVYKYNDIPWFVMMALLIGVFGGFYTRAAIAINEFRAKWPHYSKWWVRLIDCAMVATITAVVLCVRIILFYYCSSFLFLFVMSLFLSYPSIYYCLPVFSDTTWNESNHHSHLSINHQSSIINHQSSIINRSTKTKHSHFTYLSPHRYCRRSTLPAIPLPASTQTTTTTAAAWVAR